MYIDNANNANLNRDFIDEFGGFNHNLKIGENEFYDTRNMSSANYPLLSSSVDYRSVVSLERLGRIAGIKRNGNTLWFVFEASVSGHPNGVLRIGCESGGSYTTYDLVDIKAENVGKERQMINLGASIIIFPDKYYFNTADTDDKGSLEKTVTNISDYTNVQYAIFPCDIDGNEYVADTISSTEPTSNVKDGYVWYDSGEKAIKVWAASYSMWTTPKVYLKYRLMGISQFKEGDGVTITRYGIKGRFSDTVAVVKSGEGTAPTGDNPPLEADYIIVPTTEEISWDHLQNQKELLKIQRSMIVVEQVTPDMDYVCECQGRLWGCKFGDSKSTEIKQYRNFYTNNTTINVESAADLGDGETFVDTISYYALNPDTYEKYDASVVALSYNATTKELTATKTGSVSKYGVNICYRTNKTRKVNEIYASKQQDFKCWNLFQGTALDSYTVNIGASGRFTGAVNFNGKPLFSKEDRMFVIYGNYPAQYQLQENVFEGVEYNAHKSMVVYNGVLYYKGIHGIYAYSGGLPQKISYALGKLKFNTTKAITSSYTAYPCCAMAYNGVYYINLENEDYAGTYTYDIDKGIWHRRTFRCTAEYMEAGTNKAYVMAVARSGSNIKRILMTVEDDENPIDFSFNWYAVTGLIGLNTPDMKYITKVTMRYKGMGIVEIKYDSTGDWIKVADLGIGTTSKTFDIVPNRCDHFQLRFSGYGEFHLYSIAKTISTGSDVTYGNK